MQNKLLCGHTSEKSTVVIRSSNSSKKSVSYTPVCPKCAKEALLRGETVSQEEAENWLLRKE